MNQVKLGEAEALFSVLRQSADADVIAAIEALVRDAPDPALNRVNVLDFAAKRGLDEERAVAAFPHAARVGLFELSWNVLCPGCGGVLDANTSLKTVHEEAYSCALCGAGYEPTLDEMVEVNIAARVQGLAASRSIFASEPVVEHPQSSSILETSGLKPLPQRAALRGIADEFMVYEIP